MISLHIGTGTAVSVFMYSMGAAVLAAGITVLVALFVVIYHFAAWVERKRNASRRK